VSASRRCALGTAKFDSRTKVTEAGSKAWPISAPTDRREQVERVAFVQRIVQAGMPFIHQQDSAGGEAEVRDDVADPGLALDLQGVFPEPSVPERCEQLDCDAHVT